MKNISLDISLGQPLVLSQQSASAGSHHSLDYIPGATLLGVAAGRLYSRLNSDDAFALFHSGKVRFGDALPLVASDATMPVPLSWHVFKGGQATSDSSTGAGEYFDSDQVFDAGWNTPDVRQPEQLRGGYVAADGRYVLPIMEQTLKTAIAADTGTAAESQLFGYEALSAGQCYRCTVAADDALDDGLWQQLCEVLQGRARIGRSRSAQFGQVRLSQVAADDAPFRSSPAGEQWLTLWLASDLLLLRRGQPCLIPEPELLGLPEGTQWLSGQSFIRSRRYSSYNAYRRHYDPERQVISRGSVLRYCLPDGCDREAVAAALGQGIGRQQAIGLGQVIVNPALLAQAQPQFDQASAGETRAAAQEQIAMPDTRLTRVLAARAQQNAQERDIARESERIYHGLCNQVEKARSYHGLLDGVPLPQVPERSQWGRLRQLASDHRDQPERLWAALTDDENGMLRARSGWELRTGPGQGATLGQWLQQALWEYRQSSALSDLVGQLANHGGSEGWVRRCLERSRTHNHEVSA